MVKGPENVERTMDVKDVGIMILSGLTSHYGAEVRMLESSSDWPTHKPRRTPTIQTVRSRDKAMFAGRGKGHCQR